MSYIKLHHLVCGFSLVLASLPAHAVEFNVDSIGDAVDQTPGDGICATESGKCSLRAAIQETNALAGADSIVLEEKTYRLAIGDRDEDLSAEGDLDIAGDLTIIGKGKDKTIINGSNNEFRIFHILAAEADSLPYNVTLKNLGMTEGLDAAKGGLLYSDGANLVLSGVSAYKGGLGGTAVYNNEGKLDIDDSSFTENSRAVYNYRGVINVKESLFELNVSEGSAAALYNYGGRVIIRKTTFSKNSANERSQAGGAIRNTGDMYIYESSFSENQSQSGGAIYNNGKAIVNGVEFFDNSASSEGGAISIIGAGAVSIMNSTFRSNKAEADGGGIYGRGNYYQGDLSVLSSSFSGNRGMNGGAIFSNHLFNFSVENTKLEQNFAENSGGSIYLSGEESTIRNSLIAHNSAGYGAGVYNATKKLSIENTTITTNAAANTGGGIYNKGSDDNSRLDLLNSTVAFNKAEGGAGGNLVNESGRLRLARTLVSDAQGGENCAGVISSLEHNLDSDGTCALDAATDISNQDPMLQALEDSDGLWKDSRIWPAHALGANSVAINHIVVDVCPDVDQRYHYRKAGGGNCDIGSYESGSNPAASGVLSFSKGSYDAKEKSGTATLTISRTGGTEGQVSVAVMDYLTGSASAYYDYTQNTGLTTLLWGDGESTDKEFEVALIHRTDVEPDETVDFGLLRFYGGAGRGLFTDAKLVIEDNESSPGSVSFSQSSYDVSESDGTLAVTVERVNGSNGAVTVEYTTANATVDNKAIAGSDYTAASGTLSFADGVTSASFTVDITNDTFKEGDELFQLLLSSPGGGVSVGYPVKVNVTITGNDNESTGSGSSDPVTPTTPLNPTVPADPASPTTPVVPADPSSPSTPTDPSAPAVVAGPSTPSETEGSPVPSGGSGGGATGFPLLLLLLSSVFFRKLSGLVRLSSKLKTASAAL